MALKFNGVRIIGCVLSRFTGGTSLVAFPLLLTPTRQNIYVGTNIDKKTGTPSGSLAPASYLLPMRAGGLSSFTLLNGSVSVSATAIAGARMVANLTAEISLTTGELGLIINLLSALSSSGDLTTAELGAVASIEAAISASGALTTADISAIITIMAALEASGSFTTAFSNSLANMESTIGGPAELSPEGLAESLLDNSDIETGYSMREALRLILSTLAGKVSGAGTTTITIRDINDGTDRVVATVDTSGNRTSVVYDVS